MNRVSSLILMLLCFGGCTASELDSSEPPGALTSQLEKIHQECAMVALGGVLVREFSLQVIAMGWMVVDREWGGSARSNQSLQR